MTKNNYPDNWDDIAARVKQQAGWRCQRCGHPHSPNNGYTLTVHHLDNNPLNCTATNLVALCQRCHLAIQDTPLTLLTNQTNMFANFTQNWINRHIHEQGGYRK